VLSVFFIPLIKFEKIVWSLHCSEIHLKFVYVCMYVCRYVYVLFTIMFLDKLIEIQLAK